MKRFALTMMALTGSFVLTGCATTQPQPTGPIHKEFILDAAFDKVWPAVLERATDRSWPIKTIDKASGIIATDFVSLGTSFSGWKTAKTIAYEPSCMLCTWTGGARQTVTVFVTKIDESKSRVKIGIHVEAFENNVSHQWAAWQSNGANEKLIADDLAQKLNVPVHLPPDTPEPKGL